VRSPIRPIVAELFGYWAAGAIQTCAKQPHNVMAFRSELARKKSERLSYHKQKKCVSEAADPSSWHAIHFVKSVGSSMFGQIYRLLQNRHAIQEPYRGHAPTCRSSAYECVIGVYVSPSLPSTCTSTSYVNERLGLHAPQDRRLQHSHSHTQRDPNLPSDGELNPTRKAPSGHFLAFPASAGWKCLG
jgi:hypothetical protein